FRNAHYVAAVVTCPTPPGERLPLLTAGPWVEPDRPRAPVEDVPTGWAVGISARRGFVAKRNRARRCLRRAAGTNAIVRRARDRDDGRDSDDRERTREVGRGSERESDHPPDGRSAPASAGCPPSTLRLFR